MNPRLYDNNGQAIMTTEEDEIRLAELYRIELAARAAAEAAVAAAAAAAVAVAAEVQRQREQNAAFGAIINPNAARLNRMRLEREEGRRHGRSGGRRVSMKKRRSV
jgi:hypothetical protein